MLSILLIITTILIWLGILPSETWTAIATASTGVVTCIGAIVAARIAVNGVKETIESDRDNKRKELLDNLDSKSEWRKQLYDVASKTIITSDDVYRVIASLRYLPKSEEKLDDFDRITHIIFGEMYDILHSKYEYSDSRILKKIMILDFNHSEIVRLYTRYLLKHHWEYNGNQCEEYKKEEKKQFLEIYEIVQKLKEEDSVKKYLDDMKKYSDDMKKYFKSKEGEN